MSLTALSDVLEKLQVKHGVSHTMTREEYLINQVNSYNSQRGSLNEVDGYNCEKCKNKGFIAKLDENYCEVHIYCSCQPTRAALRRARKSGLGDVITDFTFKKFESTEDWQKHIKMTAQSFCNDDEAKWFYIGGQVGSGKSHICTAIAAHYIKSGVDVKYMIWAEESKRLKSFANDVSYQSLISIYKDIDVLYIDDFLKVKNGENPTAADINLAFEILNHRLFDKNKVTIISSEKTLDDLIGYDEATMSRIYQKCGKYKLNITPDRSKNYRLREV